MSYRPICDVWILARPKVRYYGAYPNGFVSRARELLGGQDDDPVLHVCSGKIRDYPERGVGPRDMTVDLDPALEPDWVMDVRKELPGNPYDPQGWGAQLADPPYSEKDAKEYLDGKGDEAYPNPNALLRRMLEGARPGGRVGMLHYFWPRPPSVTIEHQGKKRRINAIEQDGVIYRVRLVAHIAVTVGWGNRERVYCVYSKEPAKLATPPRPSGLIVPSRPKLVKVREGVHLIR